MNQALCGKLEKSKKEDKDVSDSPISDTEIFIFPVDQRNPFQILRTIKQIKTNLQIF